MDTKENTISLCFICQELVSADSSIVKFECGHGVHAECFEDLQRHQFGLCPLCRAPIGHTNGDASSSSSPPSFALAEFEEAVRLFAAAADGRHHRQVTFGPTPRQYTNIDLPKIVLARAVGGAGRNPHSITTDRFGRMYVLCDWQNLPTSVDIDGLEVTDTAMSPNKAVQVFSETSQHLYSLSVPASVRCIVATSVGLLCALYPSGLRFYYGRDELPGMAIDAFSDPCSMAVSSVSNTLFICDRGACGIHKLVRVEGAGGYGLEITIPMPNHIIPNFLVVKGSLLIVLCSDEREILVLEQVASEAQCVCNNRVSFDKIGIDDPRALALTPEGHLIITDRQAIRMVEHSMDPFLMRPFHTFPAQMSLVLNWLPDPSVICVRYDGAIIVADHSLETIYVC